MRINKVKCLIKLGMSIVCLLMCMNNNVVATNQESSKIIENETKEKIMRYDARTGETTEVDITEVRRIINNQNEYDEKKTLPYDPLNGNSNNLIKNNVMLTSADSTERILDTSGFPNRVVCRISAIDSSGESRFGTAAIVGPNICLTAAHCVFDKDNNNIAYNNWSIFPGYNNGSYYGTNCGWSQVYYSSEWMDNHSDQYDWAICVLLSDVGNQLGWFGTQTYTSNSELDEMPVTVFGYPNDIEYGFTWDARYQYKTGEKITSVGNRYFRYSALTFGGFSGGPICKADNYIVGIHFGLVWNTPTGVRITQDMVDLIRELNSQ